MAGEDDIENLYSFGESLNAAKDKSQNVKDYMGILAAATGSKKAKLLAAQLIPRFFKHFPQVSAEGLNAQFDLCEDDDLAIRIQAVRGLPFLCKDTPEHLPKLADVLCQLLLAEEQQEQIIVQNSLMQVVRQNAKDALTAVFKHVENAEDNVRDKVFNFIRLKIFPNKASLLAPPDMERHITDLIKGLQDVTGDEFQMLMNFLRTLSLFGDKAPPERMQELVDIVEAQADLDSKFDISDADHAERILACLQMAVPLYATGGSNGRFLGFINRHVLPSMDKLSESKQQDLLRSIAECSPFTAPSDARALLPSLVEILKKELPREKPEKDLNYSHVECLLYAFHQLSFKVPNATNPLCGYKAYTGQPSDRLGEDFNKVNEDWLKRLSVLEDNVKRRLKQLMAEMAENNKAAKGAADDAAKAEVKEKKVAASQMMRSCTNIEKMAKVLHAKIPSFMGGSVAPTLSWKPEPTSKLPGKAVQAPSTSFAGAKRPTPAISNGTPQAPVKRVRLVVPSGQPSKPSGQLASRALQGLAGQQGSGNIVRLRQTGGANPSTQMVGLSGRRRPWQQSRK